MASSDESVDDTDDDMISCHVCLLRFNSGERKPKFLDCHHYFCLTCIRGFSKGNSVSCPTCRHITNTAGRQIEDLSTNNIVLRLVTIALDRAREVAEREKEKMVLSVKSQVSGTPTKDIQKHEEKLWCVECSMLSTLGCQRKQHMVCNYQEVFNENMQMLEGRIEKCCQIWDKAIEDRQRVHRVYDDILGSLRILQTEIMNRVDVNDSNIALMESKKQQSRDVSIAPGGSEDQEIINTMSEINKTIAQLDGWTADAGRSQFTAQRLLQNLVTIEENLVQVSFANTRADREPLRTIELLRKLPLSFSGARHTEPINKACVSVISFLILRLAEEQSKKPGGTGDETRLHQEDNRGIITTPRKLPMNTGLGYIGEANESCNATASNAVATNQTKKAPLTFRDLLVSQSAHPEEKWNTVVKSPTKAKPLEDWQTVAKPIKVSGGGGATANKCYFKFTIDGISAERVVIQLEMAAAPIMSSKFVEMCTTKIGYQGSRIFRNMRGESVMGGSRWFHAPVYPPEEEVRKDLFVADRAEIKERRGSLRFQVKSALNGRAEVSTEFQIILANRPSHHKCTTVFGQVIEGIAVCDKISELNVKEHKVIIAECGTC